MLDVRFEENPQLMLPQSLPEDIFDIIFVEAHLLLNAVGTSDMAHLRVEFLTNIVSDVLRMHDIYDLYKEHLAGLVVMYGSWVILESLSRAKTIFYKPPTFEMLFDNEVLSKELLKHQEFFKRSISQEVILDQGHTYGA